jgi:retinol dehydrogenase-14
MASTKTAIITGGTSGLGEAAALRLAGEGFEVWIVGRDRERGQAVVARGATQGGRLHFVEGDLSSRVAIEALAKRLGAEVPKLDVLINNAGGAFGAVTHTVDGLETTFALNVFAPYLLTELLLPQLRAARGRVIALVTGIPNGATTTLDQLVGAQASAGLGGYTRSKLALAALTQEQQRRHGKSGVGFVSLHPGIIPGTRFSSHMPAFVRAIMGGIARLFGLASTLDQAAERYLRLARDGYEPGGFYAQGKLAPAPRQANDPAFARELYRRLAAIAGREDAAIAASPATA